jgi:hypothetical protein
MFKKGVVDVPQGGFTVGCARYEPTLEELKSFPEYVEFILADSVTKQGMGVLTMPKGFKRDNTELFDKLMRSVLQNPITQSIDCVGKPSEHEEGTYVLKNSIIKEYRRKVSTYRKLQYEEPYSEVLGLSVDERDSAFWRSINGSYKTLYGMEQINKTLFHDDDQLFNLNKLGTYMDDLNSMDKPHHTVSNRVKGVTDPMLYTSLPFNVFGFHVEDRHAPSVNYCAYVEPEKTELANGGKMW